MSDLRELGYDALRYRIMVLRQKTGTRHGNIKTTKKEFTKQTGSTDNQEYKDWLISEYGDAERALEKLKMRTGDENVDFRQKSSSIIVEGRKLQLSKTKKLTAFDIIHLMKTLGRSSPELADAFVYDSKSGSYSIDPSKIVVGERREWIRHDVYRDVMTGEEFVY